MANFLAEKSSKKEQFKAENNTRIIPKQSRKSPGNDFFELENYQNHPL